VDASAPAGIAARLLQYAAAAGGGAALFLLYGWRPASQGVWRRNLAAILLLGALAALAWLMAQAAAFGQPSDAFVPNQVWSVAAETGFGQAALARAVLFTLAAIAAATGAWRLTSLLAALACIGFAFGGHAAADEGVAHLIHIAADAAHALAAAVWLGALPPLLVVLSNGRTADARAGLDRFSAIGPAVVAVLVLSGAVNTWLIVGPANLSGLLTDAYGRTLAAKLALFALMLGLAAANRWRLAPRLRPGDGAEALADLKRSLLFENLLGLGVLILVALLGTLAPPDA
jgi:putative copper resistance protein D